jgi:hypothetical protein
MKGRDERTTERAGHPEDNIPEVVDIETDA